MNDELQQLVRQRTHGRCEYCQFPEDVALLPFQIDHIIPHKLHGPTTVDNLAWSCERCNSHKGPLAAGYLQGRHVRLFHPRKDRWSEHFEWSGASLLGKTDIANATIDVLSINLPYRITLRAALMAEGLYGVKE